MPFVCAKPRALLGAVLAAVLVAAPAWAQDAALTLDEALRLSGAQAPSTAIAEAEAEAARGRARQAALGPNPEASISVENFGGSGPYRGLEDSEATFTIGQRIELGGKRPARVRAARAETDVADLRLSAARADLAMNVTTQFAKALAAKARVALASAAVERAQEISELAGVLVDAGREPPLRAMRARAALADAQAARAAAEAEYAANLRALVALWGGVEPPADVAGALDTLGDAARPSVVPLETLRVRLAEAELRAAEAAVRRERTAAIPDLTLEAGVRRFEATGDKAVILGASIPIPIRNRNQGAVAAAQAEVRAAQAQRNQAIAAAVRDIGSAERALTAAQAQVAALEGAALPQAEEALRLARIGYREGKFTLLEVLDAQAAYAATQSGLVGARLARVQAAAALTRAAAR